MREENAMAMAARISHKMLDVCFRVGACVVVAVAVVVFCGENKQTAEMCCGGLRKENRMYWQVDLSTTLGFSL